MKEREQTASEAISELLEALDDARIAMSQAYCVLREARNSNDRARERFETVIELERGLDELIEKAMELKEGNEQQAS